ncbi:hypothetical protein NDU88_005947 [Pleurodeles waltl]|uniref:Uncharacterized protein n=1 Tax=Pleurodeles waltl TaxID=8319 RepID=A0AAV7WE55_PLEWA|nr:hypothetical protein NDU88_005947 [Pleurodeles waltl]
MVVCPLPAVYDNQSNAPNTTVTSPCSPPVIMGKTDKNQTKLRFDQRELCKAQEKWVDAAGPGAGDPDLGTETDLKHIPAALQQSLAMIDSKIDLLSFKMDTMTKG